MVANSQDVLGLSSALERRGWSCQRVGATTPEEICAELYRLGLLLGTVAPGRGGDLTETVRPTQASAAHPRSLSARYGLGAIPFHVELSHRPRPCRYVLLACTNPGYARAATLLLNWRDLALSPEEIVILQGAPVLVRTGRRSFYSTLLSSDRAFLRYDPCCLEAVDSRGRYALDLLEGRLAAAYFEAHEWGSGEILIIDNWRVLHARAPVSEGSARALERILINA